MLCSFLSQSAEFLDIDGWCPWIRFDDRVNSCVSLILPSLQSAYDILDIANGQTSGKLNLQGIN